MERWKDINGYEDIYQISDGGNVRNKRTGRRLQTHNQQLSLSLNGMQTNFTLGRLVWEQFVGTIPPNHFVVRIDPEGDFSLENLQLLTYSEYIGSKPNPNKNKYTQEERNQALDMRYQGYKLREISDTLGIPIGRLSAWFDES